MRQLLLSALFCSIAFCATAQDFKSAIGARLGIPASLSYKVFLSETNAVEAFGGLIFIDGTVALSANAAYQIHADLEVEGLEGLQWYYGGGAGFVTSTSSTYLTLSGYAGLSYTFDDIPLNLSVDWVPTFGIAKNVGLDVGYGALAARYILSQN
jgi:hypothetical protein